MGIMGAHSRPTYTHRTLGIRSHRILSLSQTNDQLRLYYFNVFYLSAFVPVLQSEITQMEKQDEHSSWWKHGGQWHCELPTDGGV